MTSGKNYLVLSIKKSFFCEIKFSSVLRSECVKYLQNQCDEYNKNNEEDISIINEYESTDMMQIFGKNINMMINSQLEIDELKNSFMKYC